MNTITPNLLPPIMEARPMARNPSPYSGAAVADRPEPNSEQTQLEAVETAQDTVAPSSMEPSSMEPGASARSWMSDWSTLRGTVSKALSASPVAQRETW